MPIIKTMKAEKVSTETLATKAMDVCREMLSIICDRTNKDGEDDMLNTINAELHYFGNGQQLKISKVADSLYSSLKDVLGYVMVETAKRSDNDCKFQMPKHTSYIGSIVKNTAIDVIARSERHQQYLQTLVAQTGKYRFDVTSPHFLNLYYDTITKLYERNFLFDDDPELEEIKQMIMQGTAQSATDANGSVTITVFPDPNMTTRLTTRNRVIFPYLRRLFETQKAALVTKRRVDFLNEQIQPDDEIRRVFQEKMDEAMRNSSENSLSMGADMMKAHCQYVAFNYLKETFPKERVDQMRSFIKSERSMNARSHKRYVIIPSAKRQRTEELTMQFPDEGMKGAEEGFVKSYPQQAVKAEAVENPMQGNLILVGGNQPADAPMVMPVQSNEMPLL